MWDLKPLVVHPKSGAETRMRPCCLLFGPSASFMYTYKSRTVKRCCPQSAWTANVSEQLFN